MNVRKRRKNISFLLVMTMLIFGVCFDNNVESYSFFACDNLQNSNIALSSCDFFYNTTISADISEVSFEQMYVQEIPRGQGLIPDEGRDFLRSRIAGIRGSFDMLCIINACLLLILYFLLWDFCENLHKIYSSIVIVGYIHRQDGQKVYSI